MTKYLNTSKSDIVRPKDWSRIKDMLEYLCDEKIDHRLLGFGCVELSRELASALNNRGYGLESIDFNKLLKNKDDMRKYDEFASKELGID